MSWDSCQLSPAERRFVPEPRRMTTQLMHAQHLLLDPDPDKAELDQALGEISWYSLDLNVHFKGETIRTENQLFDKLEILFDGVCYRTLKVTRAGNDMKYQAVVDKENFLLLMRHKNYGDFDGDYKFLVSSFHENVGDDQEVFRTPDTPLKLAPQDNIIDGLDDEVTITMRRGRDPTDRPAKGMQSFNLLKDPSEVLRILEHFNLYDKVTRCTKATPQRPTLQVQLKAPVGELFDGNYYKSPCLVYKPTSQSEEGGATPLFAHIHLTSEIMPRRVVIDGIFGMVDLASVKHRLSYHGELVSDLEPMMWNDPRLEDLPNGDICVFMKIKFEFNFLLFGKDSYKVTYQNQPQQCSVCYSFEHRTNSCDRRHLGRVSLHFDYLQKWKRLVGFTELRKNEDSQPTTPEGEPSQEEDNNEQPPEPQTINLTSTEQQQQDEMEQQAKLKGDSEKDHLTTDGDEEEEQGADDNKTPRDKQEGGDTHTVKKKLENAFEAEAVDPTKKDGGPNFVANDEERKKQEKLLLSSPSSIMENYEDVYEKSTDEAAKEEADAEAFENRSVEKGQTSTEATSVAGKTGEDGSGDELAEEGQTVTEVNPGSEKTKGDESAGGPAEVASGAANTEGWNSVKHRRNRNRRQKDQQLLSDSNSTSSASEPEEKERHDTQLGKRKSDSPKQNDVKKTGSGRKIGHFAEKTKIFFFEEHLKKHGEAAAIGNNQLVKKETIKRDLLAMEEKYYQLLFNNTSGTDPYSNENWNEIKKALDNTRSLLDKKAPSSQ